MSETTDLRLIAVYESTNGDWYNVIFGTPSADHLFIFERNDFFRSKHSGALYKFRSIQAHDQAILEDENGIRTAIQFLDFSQNYTQCH